jgi:glycerophosphoryl diester phosphodiesterase
VQGTSRRAVTEAHEQGLIINLWPGASIEDFQLALALGADIACTDYPVKVLGFVKENMPWITPRKVLK